MPHIDRTGTAFAVGRLPRVEDGTWRELALDGRQQTEPVR